MATPVEGPENSGQAATRPSLPIAVYRATPPTYTDGQRAELQATPRGNARVSVGDGTSTAIATVQNSTIDGVSGAGLMVLSLLHGYVGASAFDRLRLATIFKHFALTAITAGTGATIWTPAAGKKFRLMGWVISSSVAGQLIFGDNLAATVIARSEAVAAAGVSNVGDGMGNGILSAAANNVLKLDGPTGNVAGMVWGTEE